MSTYPSDPTDGFDPFDHGINTEDLEAVLAATEFRHQHAEPTVRDLNRHFIDLIGECPNTATGCWFSLNDDNSVQCHVELADVLRLGTAFQKIGTRLSLAEIRRSIPSRQSVSYDIAGTVRGTVTAVGEASVHLPTRKATFRLFKKGA
jgi:hypothetical protein